MAVRNSDSVGGLIPLRQNGGAAGVCRMPANLHRYEVLGRHGGPILKPTRLSAVSLFFVAVFVVACSTATSEADLANQALQEGLAAHQAGDLETAAALYREALKHDPQNKFAFYNLGLIDQTNGDLPSAENNYRLALGIDPAFTAALFNLAIVRDALGDQREAIELYRQVIAIDPLHAGAHLNLGLLLRSQGQTAEGDAEIRKARDIDPTIVGTDEATPPPAASPDSSG